MVGQSETESRAANGLPLLKDLFTYNAASIALDLEEAERRYDRILDRRDVLLDRMRFGALTLNAGTLLAGMSEFSRRYDLQPWSLAGSLAISSLLLGIIFAILSMQREHTHLIGRAGRQGVRTLTLRRMQSLINSKATDENSSLLGKEISSLSEIIPDDHSLDGPATAMLNASGLAWLLGISIGLCS